MKIAPLGKAVVAAPTPETLRHAEMYQRKFARYNGNRSGKTAAQRIVGKLDLA